MNQDNVILKVENLSKQYRLGTVGTGTISHDLNRWWYKVRGKEDPYLKIGETNDRTSKGTTDYVWSLKDINFEVNRGEVLGIIGKNGAGKSTLLKILSKVTTPTTGTIKTRGRIASLLEVGTGFNPELTGRENIYLNGAILGMTKAEITSKLDEIIEFSGCERYIDTPTKRYSSGMTVRLAFAVAAFLEPEILVIDEVLAVGDAEFQKKAIGKMQDIAKGEGRTVLFVSHDMSAIKKLCNKLILLKNGKVQFLGDVSEGIDRYINDNDYEYYDFKQNNNGYILEYFNLFYDDKFVNVIEVFEPCKFKGKFIFESEIPIEFKIEIKIVDLFDQVQTVMSTWLNSINIPINSKVLEFECENKNGFSLCEGEYYVDIIIFGDSIFELKKVSKLEILNSEYTNYKYPLKKYAHGNVYTPNNWKFY